MGALHPQDKVVTGEHPTGEELVRLENVGRRYVVGDNEVVALDGVSFSVAAQEFVVVLGPSGCGKTLRVVE